MVQVHPSDKAGFTRRAQAICLLLNAYKYLNPEATFRQMGDAVGVTKTCAYRYYYGIHSLNEAWNGRGCYQRVRLGARAPLMDKEYAEKILRNKHCFQLTYKFGDYYLNNF
ncbi:MAG: hypothetical protein ACO29Y_05995 [Holophagaceae bacterium]